jgi:hypothetical protein
VCEEVVVDVAGGIRNGRQGCLDGGEVEESVPTLCA